ncbi:MAG: YihY/virulence factor BrkB family protein [Acidimicrobiia bacterium]|nr:YihY/virulence factor BrkB family protein [Acidimicrobiia bacterium]
MKRLAEVALAALAGAVVVGTLLRRVDPERRQATGRPLPAADLYPVTFVGVGGTGDGGEGADGERADRPSATTVAAGVARELIGSVRQHRLVILGAGLAYYGFFTILPLTIAGVSVYGLVADQADVERIFAQATDLFPRVTAEFLENQVRSLLAAPRTGLGVATVASVVATLWSASAGVKALLSGIDAVHDDTTEPGFFLKARLQALATTLVILVVAMAAAASVAAIRPVLEAAGLDPGTVALIRLVRWPVLVMLVMGGLTVLYRSAPGSSMRRDGWFSTGALVATAAIAVVTAGFGALVTTGNLGEVYGALTGLAVLMLWFFSAGVIVLVCADLDRIVNERRLMRMVG